MTSHFHKSIYIQSKFPETAKTNSSQFKVLFENNHSSLCKKTISLALLKKQLQFDVIYLCLHLF